MDEDDDADDLASVRISGNLWKSLVCIELMHWWMPAGQWSKAGDGIWSGDGKSGRTDTSVGEWATSGETEVWKVYHRLLAVCREDDNVCKICFMVW